MTYEQFKDYIDELACFLDERDNQSQVISSLFSCDAICGIGNGILDNYIKLLATLTDDSFGWIEWYAVENDMGRLGLSAGYDGKQKHIWTTADLWTLIEGGRGRA